MFISSWTLEPTPMMPSVPNSVPPRFSSFSRSTTSMPRETPSNVADMPDIPEPHTTRSQSIVSAASMVWLETSFAVSSEVSDSFLLSFWGEQPVAASMPAATVIADPAKKLRRVSSIIHSILHVAIPSCVATLWLPMGSA